MGRVRRHLTYPNVISTLCLFVLLGAGAYAAGLGKNSVKSKQIQNGAVKTADLADNSVTSAKVADGSLLGKDFASDQLPRGATGPQGPAGDIGAVQYARVRLHSGSTTVPDSTETRLSFDQIVEDTGGMADLVNHPTTLVAQHDGVYLLTGAGRWSSVQHTGRLGTNIEVLRVDGGQIFDKGVSSFDVVTPPAQFVEQPLSVVERLSAGQQVALTAYQTTTVNETQDFSDHGAFLEMTYLGR
jgi:hypothetical protein